MNKKIHQMLSEVSFGKPANKSDILLAEEQLKVKFPNDYIDFLMESDGAEGSVGQISYLVIWPINEIVNLNEEYAVSEFTPGLVYFGSDGGDCAYAFDFRNNNVNIVEFPMDSIEISDISIISDSFEGFIESLYKR